MYRSFLIAFCTLATTPALADSIDGSWCSKDGKHLSINGSEIILPNGVKTKGAYGRHEFLYNALPSDADPDVQFFLKLRSEDSMNSYVLKNHQRSDPLSWERCAVPPKTS